MRMMYDSTNPFDIPADAAMVAGYVDGPYAWPQSGWQRFPGAVKVRIAIAPWTDDGHVLDVEQYDASPSQAPSWVQLRRRSGADPTVYCSQSAWPTVWSEFNRQGVPQPHYWIANYDGVAALPSGAVAKQYIDPPGSGGHYDLSCVADYWPGVDPEPTPPVQEDVMPAEVPFPPREIPAGSTATVQLASQVNTALVRAYVRLRTTDAGPASGTVVATGSDGRPLWTAKLEAVGGGGWASAMLPDDLDCCLEYVPDAVMTSGPPTPTGPSTIAFKVGNR